MIQSSVEALLIGQPAPFRADGATSTIGSRRQVETAIALGFEGFAGDRVADPAVHGGRDKAVHFYPPEHYPLWRADLADAGIAPHPLLDQPGGFGENIAARGLTEDKLSIGDRFRIGSAIVEISQGRQPCWKIDHHFGVRGMTAAVIRTGRSGGYFRVVEPGTVAPEDDIVQLHREVHGWTVERTFQILIGGFHKMDGAAEALRELAALEVLAISWRARAQQLLQAIE